ncbi:MAG: sigma 54-interacting transcriptional regulator [Myxococcota bacterium]
MTETTITAAHREPASPGDGPTGRPALVAVFPRATALPLPDSGRPLGRTWLTESGLTDDEVSGVHVAFDRSGGGLRVEDLGSRNGTWVDGHRLSPRVPVVVRDGATLRLGRTLFVVRLGLRGDLTPDPPLGGTMVGPYGLRPLAGALVGLAGSPAPTVLIEGETGTGKELTARLVAATQERAAPFAAVNVAGLAAGVFESQLFGHVGGAFSGAGVGALGIVRAHEGGTVFLDEIGELAPELQASLLRLLDNREVMPVGASQAMRIDVLFVAATNRDLEALSESGEFRPDLYARLAAARLTLPPLRERPEDIFALATHLAAADGRPWDRDAVEVEAVERLCLAPWPRNVRQLRATLAAAARHDPEGRGLRLWALDRELTPSKRTHQTPLTREAVRTALEAHAGNVTAAAAALGVSRGKLLRWRRKHDP